MERLIAIGDIHGCYNTFVELMKKLEYSSKHDTIVFLGDYIDRGPYSYQVVSTIRKLQVQVGSDKVICLRGNHEQFAITRNGSLDLLWKRNGGAATVYDYERNGFDIAEHIAWFRSLPLVYDTPEIIFSHAGLTYPLLKDNSADDLLWGRDWIDTDDDPREKQVIFGHTPRNTFKPYQTASGDICIDCGCVFGCKFRPNGVRISFRTV